MSKLLSVVVFVIGVAALVLAGLFRFGPLGKSSNKSIDTSSALLEAIDIADLSTAEFKYRGIAEIYKDEARTKVRCRICYNAVVKAGINMKKVKLDIDDVGKIVTAKLPAIDTTVSIVDEQSFAILPSDADVDIGSMLKISREDAENEARKSEDLINIARENLETTIEGLLLPILKPQGYTLQWG